MTATGRGAVGYVVVTVPSDQQHAASKDCLFRATSIVMTIFRTTVS